MLGVLVRTACSLAVVALILPDLAAGAQHLCGRELADTLALVCHGRGFRTADDRNKGKDNTAYTRLCVLLHSFLSLMMLSD